MVKKLNIDIMNKNILKTIAEIMILIIIITFSVTSCTYDDFVQDEFSYTAVYFPKPQIDRTFIMGEGMQIGVGVVLGGRLSNTENVEVTFSLNDDLVTDAGLTVLPTNYYQLVDAEGNEVVDKITIPAGKVQGFVYVKADSINFLADPVSLGGNYALGFQLDDVVKADSILDGFTSTLITFSYINELYGNYVQKGQFEKTEGATVETINYAGGITDIIDLEMQAPDTLILNGLGEFRSSTHIMNVIISSDNSITIKSISGAVPVTDDGGSFYNPTTHDVTLNYSFEYNSVSYKANDILDFRNRIVDGVNQVDQN
jgi:BT_3987-like, N-terminal domain